MQGLLANAKALDYEPQTLDPREPQDLLRRMHHMLNNSAGSRMGVPAITSRAEASILDRQEEAGNGLHADDKSLPGKACWREDSEGDLHLCCHSSAPARGPAASGIHFCFPFQGFSVAA